MSRIATCIEPPLLQTVLAHSGHNRFAVAQKLGLLRGTLHRKLKQHENDP